jgi:ribosome-interacting GTPase 1
VRTILSARRIGLQPAGRPPVERDPEVFTVKPALVIATGLDRPGVGAAVAAFDELEERRWPVVTVSTTAGTGLDGLRRTTFEAFDVIRVYTKEPGKPADRGAPFTLPRGATVAELAARIHKNLAGQIRFARLWGPSAFDGQAVHGDHVLAEGDVVEIHT